MFTYLLFLAYSNNLIEHTLTHFKMFCDIYLYEYYI